MDPVCCAAKVGKHNGLYLMPKSVRRVMRTVYLGVGERYPCEPVRHARNDTSIRVGLRVTVYNRINAIAGTAYAI